MIAFSVKTRIAWITRVGHCIPKIKLVNLNMPTKVINIDSEILGGTPVFNGTRVPIKNLFDYLETSETIETFLNDFDTVKREQVLKVLQLSKKLIQSSSEILHENIA